jgi:hypothetical protein
MEMLMTELWCSTGRGKTRVPSRHSGDAYDEAEATPYTGRYKLSVDFTASIVIHPIGSTVAISLSCQHWHCLHTSL